MIIKGLRGYRASMGWVHTNGEYVFVGMDDTGRCWYLDSTTGENLGSAHIEGDWARGQKVPRGSAPDLQDIQGLILPCLVRAAGIVPRGVPHG